MSEKIDLLKQMLDQAMGENAKVADGQGGDAYKTGALLAQMWDVLLLDESQIQDFAMDKGWYERPEDRTCDICGEAVDPSFPETEEQTYFCQECANQTPTSEQFLATIFEMQFDHSEEFEEKTGTTFDELKNCIWALQNDRVYTVTPIQQEEQERSFIHPSPKGLGYIKIDSIKDDPEGYGITLKGNGGEEQLTILASAGQSGKTVVAAIAVQVDMGMKVLVAPGTLVPTEEFPMVAAHAIESWAINLAASNLTMEELAKMMNGWLTGDEIDFGY